MSKPKLVIASANPGKVAELTAILGSRFDLVPRPADAAETVENAETLEGNAIKKAVEIAKLTGLPAVADDTGLFVGVLGGDPGIFSARYAGEGASSKANVDKLLEEMTDVIADDRGAEFRTVVAVILPDGSGVTGEGSVEGTIVLRRRGNEGFGYDTVFEPVSGGGLTFGQMSSSEKKDLSHRTRALESLAMALDHAGDLFD